MSRQIQKNLRGDEAESDRSAAVLALHAGASVDPGPVIDRIKEAIASREIPEALMQMRHLFESCPSIPIEECIQFVRFLRVLVPNFPKPIIHKATVEHSSLPHLIIAFAKRADEAQLQLGVETLSYRWHEGCGEYAAARVILTSMIKRTDNECDRHTLGMLVNNYGYEYFLEGLHDAALPYFREALELFKAEGLTVDIANTQANILACQFASLSLEEFEPLRRNIVKAHRVLRGRHDWRVRKTMCLYAQLAEAQGRLSVAVAWANRAAEASQDVRTQLRDEDQDYLASLQDRYFDADYAELGRQSPVRDTSDDTDLTNRRRRGIWDAGETRDSLMGLETEYAFTPFGTDGSTLDRHEYSRRLVALAKKHYASLYGCNEHDLFLGNGARLYVDSGLGLINVEYSSPECTTPDEIVAHARAGDRMLAELARELEYEHPELRSAFISKCNFDYSGHTSGSHENYLHATSRRKLSNQLIPHLVSRVPYTGSGGFDDSVPGVEFMLSPRVRFLENVRSTGSQNNRAIFCERNEPLSASRYGRLHLLCGEGVRYQMTEYLRFGVTALLVKIADLGVDLAHGIELEPLKAMNIVARDVSCKKEIGLIDGVPATAIDIQRHYLRQAQLYAGRTTLPEWAGELCERWGSVLDKLEADPMQLVGFLDWPTKLGLYRSLVEERGFNWELVSRDVRGMYGEMRDQLFEFDVRFGDISEEGPFAMLANDSQSDSGLVTDSEVEKAMRVPPQGTRANQRGEWIERLNPDSDGKRCDWSGIVDSNSRNAWSFDDPFGSSAEG